MNIQTMPKIVQIDKAFWKKIKKQVIQDTFINDNVFSMEKWYNPEHSLNVF